MINAKTTFRLPPAQSQLTVCDPLYFEHGFKRQGAFVTFHVHPFWQMEMLFTGRVEFRMKSKVVTLKQGEAIFIPPFVEHSLYYLGSGTKYLSIKFELTGTSFKEPVHLIRNPFLKILQHTISELIKMRSEAGERYLHKTFETYIPLLFKLADENGTDGELEAPGLVKRMQAFIDSFKGKRIKVMDVAKHVNVSVNYASSCFSRNMRISIKDYIDRARAEKAKKLLAYSDLRINEISDELEFPDPFTFSRYFKHHFEVSPRSFRNAITSRPLKWSRF